MAIFTPASQTTLNGPLQNKFGTPFRVTPTGEMRVMNSPRTRIIETFDTGAWDTINRWAITNGGTGVLPSAVVGTGTLNSGTTLNSFSKATTLNTPAGGASLKLADPGFNLIADRLQFELPVLATGHRFWGSGTSSATPTIAAPLIQAMGWEITTAGLLAPVVYASGTRVPPQTTDSFAQLNDGNVHKYYRWFRGDIGYWSIDDPDNVVAYYLTGAGGPDVNSLPLLYQCISNAGAAVTMNVAAISAGDTDNTAAAVMLNNLTGGYDEQRSNTDTNTAALTLTAAGASTVNSADILNVNGRGVTLGINTTVDAAGAYVINLQGKDIASGTYYTIASSASIVATGFATLTVYPGVTVAANVAVSAPLPRTWRVQAVITTGPITATVGAAVIV